MIGIKIVLDTDKQESINHNFLIMFYIGQMILMMFNMLDFKFMEKMTINGIHCI